MKHFYNFALTENQSDRVLGGKKTKIGERSERIIKQILPMAAPLREESPCEFGEHSVASLDLEDKPEGKLKEFREVEQIQPCLLDLKIPYTTMPK